MKIAIVNEFVDPRRGGAETSISQMALRLAEAGAEVAVVASDQTALPAHPRLALATLPPPSGPRWLRTRAFLRAARAWCDARGIDVLHAVTPCQGCQVYQPRGGTYRATVESGLALVSNPLPRAAKRVGRWFNLRQQLLARMERQMLRTDRPPHVAAVSALVGTQIRALAPSFPADRLHVVFNACDVERETDWTPEEQFAARRALGLAPKTPLILFVAHNFRLKGLAELIAAMAEPSLRSVSVELVVLGRDRPERMRRLAERFGIATHVRFIGPAAAMQPWFAAADVLAHPTWYDPCSRVVLEALCHGLPAVTTRLNGAAEVVGPDSGRVIETPSDAPALASAIKDCLDSDLRRRAVTQSAGLRIRLSMRRHAAELLGLYERILSGAGEIPLAGQALNS